jgi:chitinase
MMGGRIGRVAVVCCALFGIGIGPVVALQAGTASATTPIPEVAPYFETTATHSGNLATAIASHGLRSFTAAFVLGKGCTATWDDGSTITGTDARSKLVKAGQTSGATAIISFGGEFGAELAKTCTNVTSLVTAYTGVINKFGVSKIDFDVEGTTALNDTATNTRRYTAIRSLEQKFPKLEVSLTIPVGLSGFNANPTYGNAVAFLKLAKTTNTRIDVFNIMTMNYGSAVANMGTAATTAARDSMAQIKSIWPADGYKNLGITPMIGENDSAGETFTYNNSQAVVVFAHNNGVHRLAFWSLNRDQKCTGETPPGPCTGLTQQPLDFTDGFLN